MAAGGGSKAVLMALTGNVFLTIIKFFAYFLSGSGAMLAEAIHSAADAGNQGLLYMGIKKSQKGPSELHHFGYGKDRYLWALVSAAGIFFLGCGVSVTHGIHSLLNPGHHEAVGWVVVIVLAISFVVDAAVLFTAIKVLNKGRAGRPWVEYLRSTEDTATLAVLFEDGAACLGVIFAAVGIGASELLHIAWADAAAAIAIGLLLGVIAIYLGAQNRAYLLDRAVSADIQARVLGVIRSGKSVEHIDRVQTRIVGAELFSFTAEVSFDGKILSDRIQQKMDIEQAFEELKSPEDLDRLLDQHAKVVVDELGEEIDRIESEVRKQVPSAQFIQLEVD